MRRLVLFVLVIALSGIAATEAFAGENALFSVLVPGWGQVRAGHYGRGSLFLGGELVALTTLVVSDIQYDRAVEQYDRAKAAYLNASYIGDAREQYDSMIEQWDRAEDMHGIRQKALYAAIGVWAVNVVDMILFDAKGDAPLTISARSDGFLVTGSLSF